MKLTEKKIDSLSRKYKHRARALYNKGKYAKSMRYWQVAAYTNYAFFLKDTDPEIEEGLKIFSEKIKIKESECCNPCRCVFYDAIGCDKAALTQQYIRAIFATGWEMLYLVEKDKPDDRFLPILKELKQHSDKVKVHFIPGSLQGIDRLQHIYDCVIRWGGDKLFMHLYPWSGYAVSSFDALPPSITKFYINHADHTYWAGVSCLDYNFEFREYGCNVSVHNRGIIESRILLLPFYPIESDETFRGFPFEANGKIVIFSGGAYYKTFDEDDTYLKICKRLLDIDSRIHIVYAGLGDDVEFKRMIERNRICNRFHLLGFRSDISAIYEHCDFYLNTYPINGGLMCSFAAMHAVPILAYFNGRNVKPETIVCQLNNVDISSVSIDDLVEKVKILIKDESKRREYGNALKTCSIMPDQFNNAFLYSVEKRLTPFAFNIEGGFNKPNLNKKSKIDLMNNNKAYDKSIIKLLGITETIFNYPSFAINGLFGRFKTLMRIVKNYCISNRQV